MTKHEIDYRAARREARAQVAKLEAEGLIPGCKERSRGTAAEFTEWAYVAWCKGFKDASTLFTRIARMVRARARMESKMPESQPSAKVDTNESKEEVSMCVLRPMEECAKTPESQPSPKAQLPCHRCGTKTEDFFKEDRLVWLCEVCADAWRKFKMTHEITFSDGQSEPAAVEGTRAQVAKLESEGLVPGCRERAITGTAAKFMEWANVARLRGFLGAEMWFKRLARLLFYKEWGKTLGGKAISCERCQEYCLDLGHRVDGLALCASCVKQNEGQETPPLVNQDGGNDPKKGEPKMQPDSVLQAAAPSVIPFASVTVEPVSGKEFSMLKWIKNVFALSAKTAFVTAIGAWVWTHWPQIESLAIAAWAETQRPEFSWAETWASVKSSVLAAAGVGWYAAAVYLVRQWGGVLDIMSPSANAASGYCLDKDKFRWGDDGPKSRFATWLLSPLLHPVAMAWWTGKKIVTGIACGLLGGKA